MAREAFACVHRLRVRWAEVDRQDIVFNGHYLTYFDVAVTEYWRAIGMQYPERIVPLGIDLYAVKSTVEYHAPARYDDWLDVHIRCARMGRTSLRFVLEIWRGDDHLVTGELIYVTADPSERKSRPVPAPLRAAITTYERTLPETRT
jgi:acyl-CoA thioester hydrolase